MALMKTLTTEAKLKPLVAQFVPLKLDVKSDDYRVWRQRHKPPKNAIPQVFIVRADGEELYNNVGGMKADKLHPLLTNVLGKSGVILSESQATKVQQAVEKSNGEIQAGKFSEAIKTVAAIPASMDSSIMCYAEPVVQLRKNIDQLVQHAKKSIDGLNERLDNISQANLDQKIDLARSVRDVQMSFKRFKPVAKELRILNVSVNRESEIKAIMGDLKTLVSATKSKAPSAEPLQVLAKKYSGSILNREIETALKKAKSAQSKWTTIDDGTLRTWTSKGGSYSFEGTPVALAAAEIKLRGKSGKVISVKLASLSSQDIKWINSNLRQ